jgi:protein-L-isoaspartate(D-aspartate) O-methyltransferase
MKRAWPLCLYIFGLLTGCGHQGSHLEPGKDPFASERQRMIEDQLQGRDIENAAVLRAMRRVPRHRFVPERLWEYAYSDHPLPIGELQTISQPYIVAYMTQALALKPQDKVLEIGTGSGYQAAVLAEIVEEVYSIEIISVLAARAATTLAELGYDQIHLRTGDGYRGWSEAAPFDAIIVTAAPEHVPPKLVEQLVDGGRLVLPVGNDAQELVRLVRQGDEIQRELLLPVRFVPMTGEAQEER